MLMCVSRPKWINGDLETAVTLTRKSDILFLNERFIDILAKGLEYNETYYTKMLREICVFIYETFILD